MHREAAGTMVLRCSNAKLCFHLASPPGGLAGISWIPQLYNQLHTLCSNPVPHPDAEAFRIRLLDPKRDYHRLFTFLDVNGMEPTNNQAEQSLRLPVIFRKICFGNRSALGAHTLSTNLSLITTAKRQDRDPLPFLQTLLLQGPTAAQPLLYRNPLQNTS